MDKSKVNANRIGEEFQDRTKYFPNRVLLGDRPTAPVPPFKEYDAALPTVSLPKPKHPETASLWQVINARRSARNYGDWPIDLPMTSQLLWAAQGITGHAGGFRLRATPSAGARYPVETYVVAHDVDSLDQGVYHYDPQQHSLTRIKEGNYRQTLARAACGQKMCGTASLVFIWTAVVPRSTQKYAQRAYRYIYLDAGHIAQNVALACAAMGLGSCQIAAFFDDSVNAIVDVDGHDETAIYMTPVGTLKRS